MAGLVPAPPAHPTKKAGNPRERKSRGRGLRTRTGCITCRRRHLKCDEAKPVCGACARSDHTCVFVDPASIEPSTSSSRSSSTIHSTPSSTAASSTFSRTTTTTTSTTTASESLDEPASSRWRHQKPPPGAYTRVPSAPIASDDGLPRSRNGSPHPSLVSGSARSETYSPVQPYVLSGDVGATPTSHGYLPLSQDPYRTAPHVSPPVNVRTDTDTAIAQWFGLLAGDAALEGDSSPVEELTARSPSVHIAGDMAFNAAFHPPGRPAGMRMSRQLSRSHPPPPSSAESLRAPPAPAPAHVDVPERREWQSATALTLRSREVLLFNHFITNISQWIDLFDPLRHFSVYVPRLAIHNVGLLNAILALSVRHLSLISAADSAQIHKRTDGLPYYYETLHYVQKAMQYDSYNTSQELLATCLIISAYEMLDGSRKDWERHLQGVFWIQRSQVIHGESFGLKQAVWWAWLCQDMWAAFRERRKPFNSWTPSLDYAQLNPYEMAARSVYLMVQVIAFCSPEEDARARPDAALNSREESRRALLDALDEWHRHLPVEFSPLPCENERPSVFQALWIHPPAFGVAVQIHSAARILLGLHRPPGLADPDAYQHQLETEKGVHTICGLAMKMTDAASAIMSSQCLYIAGLCARDQEHRDEIVRLLRQSQQRTGWPITSLADDLCLHWNGLEGNLPP